MALDYELGYCFEPAAAPPGWKPDPNRALARFWRFAECQRLTAQEVEAWLIQALSSLPDGEKLVGIGGLTAAIDAERHAADVARIHQWLRAGDCYQVNYTFPLSFQAFGSPLALYAALRQQQPVRYGGLVLSEEGATLSLSPELFLERRGSRLVTRPMKGTAARQSDPEQLRASLKNRAENLMIVDLLRNDLGRVADIGSVQVESLFEIEAYPTVWQMVSQVAAEVSQQRPLDILRALFPCGSITGAPKVRAMQIAAELEQAPRQLYTGALGWLAPDGDFRLNVAIRTLELTADGSGRLGIGSGIVADSVAADEWQECLLKAAFLADFDPGFCLIETLRRENSSYPRLEAHLARLATSAKWLGFAYDEDEVRRQLATQPDSGIWRVRLTLDKTACVKVTAVPLAPEPDGERRALLASERIDSRHPLRRHKTSARALYDLASLQIAGRPEIFDVLFLNERGEVAEGARSNVFVERDGLLLTPPLSSGALPGVLRGELLALGRAREAVLLPADLQQGFLLGNALRGLLPVSWQEAG